MSIFLFELKAQIKDTVIWMFSLLAVLFLFMAGMYPVLQGSLDDVLRIIGGFPPEFSAAFGFDITSMFDMGGFYSFAFGYIGLTGAIMAVSFGVSSFSREGRSKCMDFLLTKPVSRERIFISKLLSNLSLLLAVNIVYIIVSCLFLSRQEADMGTVFGASLALLLTQLVFYAIGIFYAVFAKKVRSVSGIATAFGFGAFILSALVNIIGEDSIRYIAPLKYFDPTELFINGRFETPYAVTGGVIAVLGTLLAFVRFCKRDAHAV